MDRGKGPLKPLLAELGADEAGWGRIRLILIHHRVRGGSALEWCHRLVEEEKCPIPILLIGTEEESDLKRNRAVSAGAVDFLIGDPFNALRLLKSLEETLRLFT